MSRRGNCYDNAAMESWFSTLKSELGEKFETHGQAKDQLLEYIEVFCNQQRRHSTLAYVSPAEYVRIPVQADQRFWLKPISDSGSCRSAILVEADQP